MLLISDISRLHVGHVFIGKPPRLSENAPWQSTKVMQYYIHATSLSAMMHHLYIDGMNAWFIIDVFLMHRFFVKAKNYNTQRRTAF